MVSHDCHGNPVKFVLGRGSLIVIPLNKELLGLLGRRGEVEALCKATQL